MWEETERQEKQMFPILHTEDMDLWFPYLDRKTQVMIVIAWNESAPDIVHLKITMRSAKGTDEQPWRDAGRILRRRKETYPAKLQTVRLHEICETFVDVLPRSRQPL